MLGVLFYSLIFFVFYFRRMSSPATTTNFNQSGSPARIFVSCSRESSSFQWDWVMGHPSQLFWVGSRSVCQTDCWAQSYQTCKHSGVLENKSGNISESFTRSRDNRGYPENWTALPGRSLFSKILISFSSDGSNSVFVLLSLQQLSRVRSGRRSPKWVGWRVKNIDSISIAVLMLCPYQKYHGWTMVEPWFFGYGNSTIWPTMVNHGMVNHGFIMVNHMVIYN